MWPKSLDEYVKRGGECSGAYQGSCDVYADGGHGGSHGRANWRRKRELRGCIESQKHEGERLKDGLTATHESRDRKGTVQNEGRAHIVGGERE